MKTTRYIARAAAVAALYVALTVPLGELASSYVINIRPAEALTMLPLLMAEAIPGLAVGCLIANLLSGAVPPDVVFGTLATLAAAVLTRLLKKPLLGGLPPVLLNAAVLPAVWVYAYGGSYLAYALSVLATQTLWVYGLGLPLYYAVRLRRL